MKLFLLITVLIALTACAAPAVMQGAVTSDPSIMRWTDREAGVVCWVYYGYNKGGISCLPIDETRLEIDRGH